MSNVTYPDILAALEQRVTWLDLKVAILQTILNRRSEEMVRAAPIIFGPLADSLLDDVLLTLAKLYERDSARSVYKLLEAAEQQAKQIKWRSSLDAKQLKGDRATIAAQKKVLRSIEGRRNKSIAHYDKQYFHNPRKLDEDFPLSSKEVIEVLQATQDILANHSMALGGTATVSMGAFAAAATETMLLTLAAPKEQKT